jgi:predicted glycosyltransferase
VSEVPELARLLGWQSICIGKDYPNPIAKRLGLASRLIELNLRVPKFEVALSFHNVMSLLTANARGKLSVLYVDNDLALFDKSLLSDRVYRWLEMRADYVIHPAAFAAHKLIPFGAEKTRLLGYDGYKEHVYIADYQPDPTFLSNLPFRDYVVVRPEALFAAYVRETASLVPVLLRRLRAEGVNIVYLPRVAQDREYAQGLDVYIPSHALRGLDLCWHSKAVLTGSGTFAREAACMGATAVSFFPGQRLLSVDQALVDEGRVLHSRNIDEIVRCVTHSSKRPSAADLQRAKRVKAQVARLTRGLLEKAWSAETKRSRASVEKTVV